MKLIIDIPEEEYKLLQNSSFHTVIEECVRNGTPIPDNATACDIEQIRNEIEEASNRCNNAIAKGCYLFCLGVINKYMEE